MREKRGEKEGGEEFADGGGFQVFLHAALSREGTRLRLFFFRSELSLSLNNLAIYLQWSQKKRKEAHSPLGESLNESLD